MLEDHQAEVNPKLPGPTSAGLLWLVVIGWMACTSRLLMLRNNQPYLNLKLLRSDKCRKQTIRIFSLVAYYPSWDEEDHWCLPQSFLTKTVTIFLGALVCSSPWTFWGPLPLALVWIENRFHPNLDRARKMFSPIDTITAQQICLL